MKCGLGVRSELFEPIFSSLPDVGFLEAHSENYFGESLARAKLMQLREHYPMSLHGVGLSLGRADALNQAHLAELKCLVDEIEPLLVSEHLAWSAYSHRHVPDLLPLPLSEEALALMCQHVDQMQTALGRSILVENPSNYLVFDQLQIPEPEFLNALAEKTGCGLLVDINNIYVSAVNVGRDPLAYLNGLNEKFIGQYHLAGHTQVTRKKDDGEETVLIDTHNQTVTAKVWELYAHALTQHGAKPTLLEWDSDFPEFATLLEECATADDFLGDMAVKNFSSQPKPCADLAHSIALESSQHSSLLHSSLQKSFLDSVFNLDDQLASAAPEYRHRIGVYQNNVYAACRDYLAEVYPATQGVLGAQYFKQLAQQLVRDVPPSAGNITLYGAELKSKVGELEALHAMPYLADLIKFEWALHAAYFAPVADSLDHRSVSQPDLLALPVQFNLSVELIESNFPIYQIHRQSLPDYPEEVAIELTQSQDQLLIYKCNHSVETLVLQPEQALLFTAIKENQNLLQAIESLAGSISPESLSATLSLIFEQRILLAVNK